MPKTLHCIGAAPSDRTVERVSCFAQSKRCYRLLLLFCQRDCDGCQRDCVGAAPSARVVERVSCFESVMF